MVIYILQELFFISNDSEDYMGGTIAILWNYDP